ncbi:GTP cyclohydrolase 1 type 2 [BD1-7 clade bacterium]|uniref:GTP cyclohydrolase 1 type 2 n=1 Tax=BD1-7 clade bacterium TaxID=2029982 RepID=A0A5S9N503_9GAMM|nr:GTP cyclohydrolase 1 type 2 [BD1-7 clade bacterium]
MYKFCFYVPSADAVKTAVFATGAGAIGDYRECCFESAGTGQFRALDGANPAIGLVGDLEHVDELKVELVCATAHILDAVRAMINAHPYEEPAYEVWPVLTLADLEETLG